MATQHAREESRVRAHLWSRALLSNPGMGFRFFSLDWREICDLLQINQCDEEEEEYRCAKGMCIPEQFFLDGDLDCRDWSDEISLKIGQDCPSTSVNRE